ncbi:hypothetical protein GCM10009117_26350 [Gangjinia marincola]|uniref:CpeT/CpcT family protein DUF1001 n=1 Tax=Gangjinia marincola TaxID=578463 RepID=A0ABN1MJX3_9FLAO
MISRIAFLCFLAVSLIACKRSTNVEQSDIAELHEVMQGTFSSKKQSLADSTYFNIILHMYPIWQDKGAYLYVEQSLSNMPDQPYRQRIYELKKASDSTIASVVYELPNPELYIGKWENPYAFEQLDPSDLIERNGCAVVLKKVADKIYEGSTNDRSCESSLRGASFASSEVTITPNKIISWDRGFDNENKQVWGAKDGGYVFDKL